MPFQAISEILKLGYGAYQTAQATNTLNTSQRPTYKTPGQIKELEALSRQQYGDPFVPGQTTAQDRIDQNAATAYQQSAGSGNPFAAIAAIQANQQAGTLDLQTAAAQTQRQDLEAYKQALQVGAQYEDAEFQLNEFAPYADIQQEARDQLGAGTKNIYSGTSGLGSIASALTASSIKGSQGGDGQSSNTDAIYNQYSQNEYKPNYSGASDYLSGNIKNPNANVSGKTWNEQLQMWI